MLGNISKTQLYAIICGCQFVLMPTICFQWVFNFDCISDDRAEYPQGIDGVDLRWST